MPTQGSGGGDTPSRGRGGGEPFTLDGAPECIGTHPEEQTQGVIVMPDEHIPASQEVCEFVAAPAGMPRYPSGCLCL